jgi:hypothetical protein
MAVINDDSTVGEAKAYLRTSLKTTGARCPCCTQFSKMYRWSLYSTAVRALSLYYRLGGTTDFVHSNDLKDHGHRGQGDASRLSHWGLVEEQKVVAGPGARSGYWRVTKLGEDFLLDRVRIPKYVWVYDSKPHSFEGDLIGVKDALGKKFSYASMMAGV